MSLRTILVVAMAFIETPVTAADCFISTAPIMFGTINPLQQSQVDGTGAIAIDCSASSDVTIAITPASHLRIMAGIELLTYNIYSDSARTRAWGDGTGIGMAMQYSGTKFRIPVYGRVLIPANATPGIYADTLTITIIW